MAFKTLRTKTEWFWIVVQIITAIMAVMIWWVTVAFLASIQARVLCLTLGIAGPGLWLVFDFARKAALSAHRPIGWWRRKKALAIKARKG